MGSTVGWMKTRHKDAFVWALGVPLKCALTAPG